MVVCLQWQSLPSKPNAGSSVTRVRSRGSCCTKSGQLCLPFVQGLWLHRHSQGQQSEISFSRDLQRSEYLVSNFYQIRTPCPTNHTLCLCPSLTSPMIHHAATRWCHRAAQKLHSEKCWPELSEQLVLGVQDSASLSGPLQGSHLTTKGRLRK